ncbi:MAG: Crp/Fnr family transcriptional regulator [Methyloligellaceae bacterium]
MADDELRSLQHIVIFASLTPETLQRLESRCRWRAYHPGKEVIPFQGNATDVYFLISGSARVIIHSSTGRDVTFRSLAPGDVFGDYAAIDGRPRSASVEVLEPSTVASMPSSEFRNVIADEPDVAKALLQRLTAEIRRLTSRIFEFSTFPVRNRIHAELLRLAGGLPPTGPEAVIRPMPTNSEIASRISTHREAVSRELSRLRQLGVVERQGSDLIIKDLLRLAEMVEESTGE